jgi:ligand-binding sensor domain-containing protein
MKLQQYLFLACLLFTVGVVAQPKSGRVFLTKTRGESWLRADKGLPESATINAFAVVDRTIVAGTEEHGIYLSEDGLKNWKASSKGLPLKSKINALIAFKDLLFAGTFLDGVYVSANYGASWQPVNEGLQNLTIRCFYAIGHSLYVGTDAGIYQTLDEGKTWTHFFYGPQVNSITSCNNIVLAATSQGIVRFDGRQNGSWVWKQGVVNNIVTDGKNLVALTPGSQIQLGMNGGKEWISVERRFGNHTFNLTPASEEIPVLSWKNYFRALLQEKPFESNGLPEHIPFSQLIETPYGLLAAMGQSGC